MTAEELYAMEAETGRTSEWEPLYRAEKRRADELAATLAERDRWMTDNLREVELDVEPWWAPIDEIHESGERWREACERAEAAVARVRALHGNPTMDYRCSVCRLEPWPCRTYRELDAP